MPVLSPTLKLNGSPPASARVHVALSGVALAVLTFAAQRALHLTAWYPYVVLLPFAVAGSAVAVLADRHLQGRVFGAANQVTLLRAALAALLLGLVGETASAPIGWFVEALAVPALLLDGVDGWLARRRGTASDFGARFDMETDAALILVLAVLAWRFEKAGSWVLLAGLARYGFVAAGLTLFWLRRRLPSSRRRQTVCVIQIAALLLCLAPALDAPVSSGVALAGVLALLVSFAIDVRWLARAAAAS